MPLDLFKLRKWRDRNDKKKRNSRKTKAHVLLGVGLGDDEEGGGAVDDAGAGRGRHEAVLLERRLQLLHLSQKEI